MNDIGIPNFNPLQSVWGQFGPRQTKIPLNTTLNILMYDWECVPNISNLICRKHKSNRNSSFWNMINCSDQYFKIIIFELIRKWTKKFEGLLYNRKWRFFHNIRETCLIVCTLPTIHVSYQYMLKQPTERAKSGLRDLWITR